MSITKEKKFNFLFLRLNENIYKIGRTSKTNPEDRFQKYRSEANYENFSSFHNFKELK